MEVRDGEDGREGRHVAEYVAYNTRQQIRPGVGTRAAQLGQQRFDLQQRGLEVIAAGARPEGQQEAERLLSPPCVVAAVL
jgi:hypothetical protein